MTRHELKRALLSFIAPNRCPFCDRVIGATEYWHEACFMRLKPYEGSDCPEGLDGFSAPCVYKKEAKQAVLRFKNGEHSLSDAFALLIAERLGQTDADVIVPVPSSAASTFIRGFQPAAKLALSLSAIRGIPVKKGLVSRGGVQQKTLRAKQRRINAQIAYHLRRGVSFEGKRVLLVDDICTTGSTLSACAELLRQAGAREVTGAAFAKVVLTRSRERKKYRVVNGGSEN